MTVAASFAATLVDEWVRAGLTDARAAIDGNKGPLSVGGGCDLVARDAVLADHSHLQARHGIHDRQCAVTLVHDEEKPG